MVNGAMTGAELLVQPSFSESFSLALYEAWTLGKAALVQGHSAVLEGQASRSGAAIPYHGYAEFEAALDLLLGDQELRRSLGSAGQEFAANFAWERVVERYEQFFAVLESSSRN
jgi:glycosyltransferase involved in cell wall biosynthesis